MGGRESVGLGPWSLDLLGDWNLPIHQGLLNIYADRSSGTQGCLGPIVALEL